MTQEDKELLLEDLCGRLPYGVKVLYENKVFSVDYISAIYKEIKLDIPDNYTIDISDVKPYLFPLSSMTEEEWADYQKIRMIDWVFGDINGTFINAGSIADWLNAHHFDYRGLIEKGLAIDATGLNIY